jgi:YtkA-like
MTKTERSRYSHVRRVAGIVLAVAAVAGLTGCSHMMMMLGGTGATKPAASEFGLGPRASARGVYVATLAPGQPLRPRQLQTVRVTVVDDSGRPVDGAMLAIDGGMPEHGHGLPTRPRVTRNLGDGIYEIEGVRFNMGGWWEFKVEISAGAGTDVVTFNLAL